MITENSLASSESESSPAGRPDANLLTHSREACFKICPRKHYLAYELGLRPSHTADPLRKGSGFHIGLEAIKGGLPEDQAAESVRALYFDAACPPWLSAEEFATERETICAMVIGWGRRWRNDLILDYAAVEIPFEIPIINPSTGKETPIFRSAGKIDGIANLPDGRLAMVEHKTVGESIEKGSDYWGKLLMDGQISRYMLAARAIGFDVKTTIYDVTRKPAIKPKAIAKADRAMATSLGNYCGRELSAACPEQETPELFAARLLKDMADRPDFYFARMEISRLDSDLEEFRAEQWSIQRSIRAAQLDQRQFGSSAWPRNTGACTTMGRCPYFDICRGTRGDITQEIPAGFQIVDVLHQELAKQKQEQS